MSRPEWVDLVIIGAGGHGSEVLSYVRDLIREGEKIRVAGFVDERRRRGSFGPMEILGGFAELEALVKSATGSIFRYITAVGDNGARKECVSKLERLEAPNLGARTLRHPRSVVGEDVVIGEGTCLAPGSILTTKVRMGNHCIVNVNASISHDAVVGDFVNLNPGVVVAGNACIGEGAYIGAGATVIDKVSVGDWSVIGAGAVVVDDIPPHVTAVGVPARIIKTHDRSR
jgi:acetyltransferase EpsM